MNSFGRRAILSITVTVLARVLTELLLQALGLR